MFVILDVFVTKPKRRSPPKQTWAIISRSAEFYCPRVVRPKPERACLPLFCSVSRRTGPDAGTLIHSCEVLHLAATGLVAWLGQPDAWNQALRDFNQVCTG